MQYILARCDGTGSQVKKRIPWFRENKFSWTDWGGIYYWTKLVEDNDVEDLTILIDGWDGWITEIRPGPEPVADNIVIIEPTFPLEVRAALRQDVDHLKSLSDWIISSIHKKRLIDTLIKKYERARDTGTYCTKCHIRPLDVYETECRRCQGLSPMTWKSLDPRIRCDKCYSSPCQCDDIHAAKLGDGH